MFLNLTKQWECGVPLWIDFFFLCRLQMACSVLNLQTNGRVPWESGSLWTDTGFSWEILYTINYLYKHPRLFCSALVFLCHCKMPQAAECRLRLTTKDCNNPLRSISDACKGRRTEHRWAVDSRARGDVTAPPWWGIQAQLCSAGACSVEAVAG